MDFRDYDPAIGRWTGIDPVVHYSQSTYNAFDGNPVFWVDPSGADATTYVKGSDGEWKVSSYKTDEEFETNLRNKFKARFGNLDPDAVPEGNMQSVCAILNDVKGLAGFYKKSGMYDIILSLDSDSENRGYTIDGKIYLYKGAFISNLWLASTLFHEFFHAYQETYKGGIIYDKVVEQYGRTGVIAGTNIPTRASMELERQAYQFEWNLGNHHYSIRDGIIRNTVKF